MAKTLNSSEKIYKDALDDLKKEYLEIKKRIEFERSKLESIKVTISSFENTLCQFGYLPDAYLQACSENEWYEKVTIIEAACKLLSMKGELTTKEIYIALKEKGKEFKAKQPINSLTATLHNAAKINKRIVHIRPSKWKINNPAASSGEFTLRD